MDRLKRYLNKHTNPPVFLISGAVVILFLVFGSIAPDELTGGAAAIQNFITYYLGWFYILSVSFFLAFCLILMVSRFGRIKLGPDDSEPAYSTTAWFAMLFTAGMGIGLVYYGVAEPVDHYFRPATGAGGTPTAAAQAMNWTFYHWGLHAWAIYIILGLAMGYFHFRRGLPLRPAAAFHPLIGDRIYGPIGNLVDILAVFGTLYGLATSIGIGAEQITAGLHVLFGVTNDATNQVLVIVSIEAVAITSVMLGLDKGVRNLSLINLWLAVVLMLAVFAFGPTLYELKAFPNYLGNYFQNLVGTSFTLFTHGAPAQWQADWTLFYWSWWVSWSPFVGMFIARISYGRTVRQFVAGALFAPAGASFVWFTVFGGGALWEQMFNGVSLNGYGADQMIFELIKVMPFGWGTTLVSGLTIVVVTLFFATSSDSGSYVVDMLTNGGDPHPVATQRLFWAVTEGLVAIVLLLAGGVSALQTAAITTGLPFTVVLLLMCWSLWRVWGHETARVSRVTARVR